MNWSKCIDSNKLKFIINFDLPKSYKGYPKLVKGKCSMCKKIGSDFQISPSKIICGDCKIAIGKKILNGE